jgi:hypothetical protein
MAFAKVGKTVEVDLHALGMQIVHAQKPLGEGRPPEAVLRFFWILLDGIVVDVFVHLEGEGKVLLRRKGITSTAKT